MDGPAVPPARHCRGMALLAGCWPARPIVFACATTAGRRAWSHREHVGMYRNVQRKPIERPFGLDPAAAPAHAAACLGVGQALESRGGGAAKWRPTGPRCPRARPRTRSQVRGSRGKRRAAPTTKRRGSRPPAPAARGSSADAANGDARPERQRSGASLTTVLPSDP